MYIIFSKISPKHIEATSMAFLSSVSNFRSTSRGLVGTWINDKFVGVTTEDLSDYYILVLIGLFMSFLPLLFIRLIPTRAEVNALTV